MAAYRMRIHKYLPDRLYGFAIMPETGQQVFFHLGSFDPGEKWTPHSYCMSCPRPGCEWSSAAPPPVTGEPVDVQVELDKVAPGAAVPRATRVIRLDTQTPLKGKIKTFDNQRGYGFIEDTDGVTHYMHKSDIIGHRIPILGQTVMFFAGQKDNKSRACHVRLCQ